MFRILILTLSLLIINEFIVRLKKGPFLIES